MHFIFIENVRRFAMHFIFVDNPKKFAIHFILQLNLKEFAMECKFVGINGYICNGLHFWGYDRTKAIHITS